MPIASLNGTVLILFTASFGSASGSNLLLHRTGILSPAGPIGQSANGVYSYFILCFHNLVSAMTTSLSSRRPFQSRYPISIFNSSLRPLFNSSCFNIVSRSRVVFPVTYCCSVVSVVVIHLRAVGHRVWAWFHVSSLLSILYEGTLFMIYYLL